MFWDIFLVITVFIVALIGALPKRETDDKSNASKDSIIKACVVIVLLIIGSIIQIIMINNSNQENITLNTQLNSILSESKRSNYKIKPLMDIAVFIPLENYSIARDTKYKIPTSKTYFALDHDTIFNVGPDMNYFTDSLSLKLLKDLFGPNLLIKLKVVKPGKKSTTWINSTYKVQLVEKDTTRGFKIAANWYANLFEELKDKSDRKNYRTNYGIEGKEDKWRLRINIFNVPIGIENIHPDLSLLDFMETGTKYEIELNGRPKDYDYMITIKGEYSNYMSKILWDSYPINDTISSRIKGSSQFEKILTKSLAVYDTNSYWLPVEIP